MHFQRKFPFFLHFQECQEWQFLPFPCTVSKAVVVTSSIDKELKRRTFKSVPPFTELTNDFAEKCQQGLGQSFFLKVILWSNFHSGHFANGIATMLSHNSGCHPNSVHLHFNHHTIGQHSPLFSRSCNRHHHHRLKTLRQLLWRLGLTETSSWKHFKLCKIKKLNGY